MTFNPRITQALRPAEDGTMKRKKKLRWGKTSWCTKPPRKIRYRTKLDAKLTLASTQRSRNPRREERRLLQVSSVQGLAPHLTLTTTR